MRRRSWSSDRRACSAFFFFCSLFFLLSFVQPAVPKLPLWEVRQAVESLQEQLHESEPLVAELQDLLKHAAIAAVVIAM